MDVQAISTALVDALADLEIGAYDYAPDVPGVSPAAYVYPAPFTYDATFPDASQAHHDDVDFIVRFLVSSQITSAGQAALNALISDEGAGSAVRALSADPTLGGVVNSLHVTDMRNYGVITFGAGTRYYSAELVVNILT